MDEKRPPDQGGWRATRRRWPDGEMALSTDASRADEAHMRFDCFAEEPPEDRWRSLAETIAPVPDEG